MRAPLRAQRQSRFELVGGSFCEPRAPLGDIAYTRRVASRRLFHMIFRCVGAVVLLSLLTPGCNARTPSAPARENPACAANRAEIPEDPARVRTIREAVAASIRRRWGDAALAQLRSDLGGACHDYADLRCSWEEVDTFAWVTCYNPTRHVHEARFIDGQTLRPALFMDAITLLLRDGLTPATRAERLLYVYERFSNRQVVRTAMDLANIVGPGETVQLGRFDGAIPPGQRLEGLRFVAYEGPHVANPRALLHLRLRLASRSLEVIERVPLASLPVPVADEAPREGRHPTFPSPP